ncbi:MAG: DUF1385 domain-containing protein [Ruminococcaceae bacterium]|nr:DUF1385 domain-containing protein [Oscillospiraceae bacterium]
MVSERRGKVGGQAVIEGLMMRGKTVHSTALRTADGNIIRDTQPNKSVKDKVKFLKLPILRGIVSFIESLILSMAILTYSAEALGIEAEEESKFDKWLTEKLGDKLMPVITTIGMVLGVGLALVLFMWLPAAISKLIGGILPDMGVAVMNVVRSVIEGCIKIGLFVLYVWAVSFMPDIRRTFQYHGAEHKTIFCYENGLDLTVENIKVQKRQHPRCGTSFMIVMMIVSIIVSSFISWDNILMRTFTKILTLPLVIGIGYEFLMYAGKHDNVIIRILSAPGLWLQNITTIEPEDDQIEVAIVALKSALPDEFPEESVFENITLPAAADTETDGQ